MYQLELWNDDVTLAYLFTNLERARKVARYWEDVAEVQLSGPYFDTDFLNDETH